MNEPLEELYFVWLYELNADPSRRSRRYTYWNLFRRMHTTEFEWHIHNDQARVEDGVDLRREFIIDAEIPYVDDAWFNQGCSFLEMLVALSRRMAFEADSDAPSCFWNMLENISLFGMNDTVKNSAEIIDDALRRVIDRKYEPNGEGGLFPLVHPKRDQRRVELWYQLNAYILEFD